MQNIIVMEIIKVLLSIKMFFFCVFAVNTVNAGQNNNLANIPGFDTNVMRPVSSYFFHAKYGKSYFTNSLINLDNWNVSGDRGIHLEIGFQSRIRPTNNDRSFLPNSLRRVLSYGIGLGISQYGVIAQSDGFKVLSETSQDLEGILPQDTVLLNMDFQNLSENFHATYLHFPLFIELGTPNIDKLGVFLRLGTNISIPLFQSFEGSGLYSVEGTYEHYDITLTDIPELGFVHEDNYYLGNEKYSLSPVNLSGFISAGASYPIPRLFGWIVHISLQYNFGISDMVKENALSTQQFGQQYKMIFNNHETTHSNWFGIQLGVKYALGFY